MAPVLTANTAPGARDPADPVALPWLSMGRYL
jgi:hypothetical protein